MHHNITYGQLRQLFLNLGFEDQSGEFLIFQHPDSRSALLRMALHEEQEVVLGRDLVAARALLDMHGLMDRDEFDQWAHQRQSPKAAAS